VEGLRAVAVLFVVLYHAGVPGIKGGYVGVDVFFVISGFLITGILFRETDQRGRISLIGFYARRARRILPAATVLIVFTVLASYHWLGFLEGNAVAVDAKWSSVFLANFHFASIGTQYFSSQAPPSPLLHMWSLSVEEQFYAVWPLLLLVMALLTRGRRLRLPLGLVLGVIVVASFTWSIVETNSNGVWAYFSPFTRAWELAAGGLIAIAAPVWPKIPTRVAWVLGYLGLLCVVLSGLLYTAQTHYPGSAVAFPVLGTCAVIAAGSALQGSGVELFLRPRPVQWIGARSYSWYLWHWPLLVIPAEYAGTNLSVWKNLGWVTAALVVAMISYRLIESPIRGSRTLRARRVASIAMGVVLILASLAVAQFGLRSHSGAIGINRPPVGVHVSSRLSEAMSNKGSA
jgi:peptidoglycan/LPS O-acetylase OafA/YrhL